MFEQLKALVAAQTQRTGKRRTIHLADETLRDGQQCLWATRMRTEHMLPIAERWTGPDWLVSKPWPRSSLMRACCS